MVWTPVTRAVYDKNTLWYASDTTDYKWPLIAPLMPG